VFCLDHSWLQVGYVCDVRSLRRLGWLGEVTSGRCSFRLGAGTEVFLPQNIFLHVNTTFHFPWLWYLLPTSTGTGEKLLKIHSSSHPEIGKAPLKPATGAKSVSSVRWVWSVLMAEGQKGGGLATLSSRFWGVAENVHYGLLSLKFPQFLAVWIFFFYWLFLNIRIVRSSFCPSGWAWVRFSPLPPAKPLLAAGRGPRGSAPALVGCKSRGWPGCRQGTEVERVPKVVVRAGAGANGLPGGCVRCLPKPDS